jgi:hypothetical protein
MDGMSSGLLLQQGIVDGQYVAQLFKRLKSVVQMGHVPKLDDGSSRAWLYGKLLVALLTEKLARVGSAISPWGYYLTQEARPSQPMA